MRFVPYLNFDGTCAEAFRAYERILGGRIDTMMTHGESPIAGQVQEDWHERILHARLAVGDQLLFASDSPPGQHKQAQGLWVSIQVDEPEQARRIFDALADGGNVVVAFEKTFWAEGGFGMCVDRFGTPWMVNCESGA